MPAYRVYGLMRELAAKFPDGFQLALTNEPTGQRIALADTLGTGKHLAALAACEQG